MSQHHFSTQIVRLGGLIGDDRHPVKQLAKLPIVHNPEAPINLIHKTDAIGLLRYFLKNKRFGRKFIMVLRLGIQQKRIFIYMLQSNCKSLPQSLVLKRIVTKVVSDPYIELGLIDL
ncbi:MAG: hypothetical protein CM15mP83_2810 [Flavobacteriaceae bacterium]|nr:MAG: hypothetical protein CM15mP83_2810 [Flavobacteriaceae bacterium]